MRPDWSSVWEHTRPSQGTGLRLTARIVQRQQSHLIIIPCELLVCLPGHGNAMINLMLFGEPAGSPSMPAPCDVPESSTGTQVHHKPRCIKYMQNIQSYRALIHLNAECAFL